MLSVGALGRLLSPTPARLPLTFSPFPSLPSSGLSLEGALLLSQALDGCPYVEEIR